MQHALSKGVQSRTPFCGSMDVQKFENIQIARDGRKWSSHVTSLLARIVLGGVCNRDNSDLLKDKQFQHSLMLYSYCHVEKVLDTNVDVARPLAHMRAMDRTKV